MLNLKRKLPKYVHRNQLGASLIEVLVAILLMSFGMLALAGMQAYAVAAQKNAANRAIASALANELAELIRLNPTGLKAGNYDVEMMMMTPNNKPDNDRKLWECEFPSCIPATLASTDLTRFQNRVRNQLPLGDIKLSRPAVGGVMSTTSADLWVLWEEPGVLDNARTIGGSKQSAEFTSDNCPANVKNLTPLPRCFYMKVQL